MATTVSRAYYDVYLGFWINWNGRRINGSTLTLTRKDGALLISFIAIFIALSGKSFWRICCFVIHRCLSTTTPEDGLHHQRQAILRNADTPEDGAWRMIQILIAWRSNSRRPLLRLLPLAILAFLTFSALLVGGIFSSRLMTDDGSEVLIKGKTCGPVVNSASSTRDAILLYRTPQLAQRSTAYTNYAMQCYSNATNSEDCHLYVKPRIATSVIRNASCPFAEEMCKSKDGNIIVDSGLMDSHYDLGINSPPHERFQLRYVHHCAPIVSQGYKKVLERSNDSNVPEIVQYFYGNLTYGLGAANPDEYTGFTYEVLKNFTNLNLPGYTTAASARPEYRIGSVGTSAGILSFEPIEQLRVENADTLLMFLDAQGIGFSSPVDDLWFSAHEKWLKAISATSDENTHESYLSLIDEPASTLGCTAQAQFCNPMYPEGTACEPLGSWEVTTDSFADFWSKEQIDAINWVSAYSEQEQVSVSTLVNAIGTSVLAARYDLAGGLSGPLPDNQWQIEVEHFVGASLASLQGTVVEAANGPTSEGLKELQVLPDTDVAKRMCVNQKIRSTLYASFSVLPLALILIIGGILITTDIFLEPALNSYQNRRAKSLPHYSINRSTHSRLEWRSMSILQLQRMAHEGIGSGEWLKTTSENPITVPFQKLGMLDIRDKKRPLLRTRTDELMQWFTPPPAIRITTADSEETLHSLSDRQSQSKSWMKLKTFWKSSG
ncbi:hypothetical protein K491DRAFT_678705 [Lophiostoma macrostomum CBS 122681]|uniref:Uncharacterized protein n=1 Tax=Lophiostoma macrostomum CBS 122681 TaxID=1314788 RepID=A0A6A6T6J1_9PLEO|nr:hypothetical protein K491DRAFT_678705 [Lophiostoma macrostomum CBS 122681]